MRLLILILTFATFSVKGQISNQLTSSNSDIYIYSLKKYIEISGRSLNNRKQIFMKSDAFNSHILPNKINDVEIVKLNNKELKKLIKKKKIEYLTSINPVTSKKDTFSVSIVNYKVSYKRRIFHYVNEGGINFNYLIDCETGLYTYIDD